MCRRVLPPIPPIDYTGLVRDAVGADLSGLQRSYKIARCAYSADAKQAKESILAIVAERLWAFNLNELCDVLELLPMEEPLIWAAVGKRVDALADQVVCLEALHDIASCAEVLCQASYALESTVDRALTRTMQRVMARASLRELWAGAVCFKALASNPCVDRNMLAMAIHDALQGILQTELDPNMMRNFVALLGALTGWRVLTPCMESYIAHLFSARVIAFIASAGLDELDAIEDQVLPQLPSSQIWKQASQKILAETTRQTERLTRLGGIVRSGLPASFTQRRREARVQSVLRGLQQIDADMKKESSLSKSEYLKITCGDATNQSEVNLAA